MNHRVLWSSFINYGWPEPWSIPKVPVRILNKIEEEDKEWQTPPEQPIELRKYRWIKYTIVRNWTIRWKNWKEIKPKMKWKYAIVTLYRDTKDAEWKFVKQEIEINILSLMEIYYWKYIRWHLKHLAHPDEYELITIDRKPKNLKYSNLKYVKKTENPWNNNDRLFETLKW